MQRMLFGCAMLLSLGTLQLQAAAVSGMPTSTFLNPATSDEDGFIEEVFFDEPVEEVQQVIMAHGFVFNLVFVEVTIGHEIRVHD